MTSEAPERWFDRGWRAFYIVAYRLLRVWWFFRRPLIRGAFVAVWHDDALLVIRNSYRRAETLPSGRINRGETPRAAARRELLEEVGIAVEEQDLVQVVEFDVQFKYAREHSSIFEHRPRERPVPRVDRREVTEAFYVERAALADRALTPYVRDYLAWLDEREADRTPERRQPSE